MVRPTPKEVTDYAKSIGFILDGEYWVDFYTSKGWVIGKSAMKDWKAAVRTWKKNNFNNNGNGNGNNKSNGNFKQHAKGYVNPDDLKAHLERGYGLLEE